MAGGRGPRSGRRALRQRVLACATKRVARMRERLVREVGQRSRSARTSCVEVRLCPLLFASLLATGTVQSLARLSTLTPAQRVPLPSLDAMCSPRRRVRRGLLSLAFISFPLRVEALTASFDDQDTFITYSPRTAWRSVTVAEFVAGGASEAVDPGAKVEFSFAGASLSLSHVW